jgi:hypothetical protein
MSAPFSVFDPSSWAALAPYNLSQSILPGWSMVTVNETNSSAPETEQRIVAQDSYGRQIGKMMDVIDLLLKEAEKTNPALKNTKAVKDLAKLETRIDKAKQAADQVRQDRLLQDLLALKGQNEALFETLIRTAQSAPAPKP